MDRLGLNRSNWWKLCAASADYSSRRRADRARSSMPQRAARGAGSRARRRLEPPLCRPLARRRAVNRHLHYAFTQGAWPPRALNSLLGAVSTRGEPFNFSRQAIKDKNHRRLDSVGLRPPRESEIGCAVRLLRPAITCVSGFHDGRWTMKARERLQRVRGSWTSRRNRCPSAAKDGTLVVPVIAEGKLTVYLHDDPALPARPRPIGDVEIWSNQTRRSGNY